MKAILGLCLALMVFISSDWVIQGTGAIKCMTGKKLKCDGKICAKWKLNSTVDLKSLPCDETHGKQCYKGFVKGTGEGTDVSVSEHGCGDKEKCDAFEKSFNRDKQEMEYEGKQANDGKAVTYKMECTNCDKDECNAAPKSAQGLELVMMTAALATVVILGM